MDGFEDLRELRRLALPYGRVRMMLPPLDILSGTPFLLLTMMIGGFLPVPAVIVMLGAINTEERGEGELLVLLSIV